MTSALKYPSPDFLVSIVPTDPVNPDTQTADTIGLMRGIVRRSVNDPICIQATREALNGVNLNCEPDVAIRLFRWIKSNIRFMEDPSAVSYWFGEVNRNPNGEDFLITPRALLSQVRSGDCDDFSMLAATMLKISGLDARFVTIAADTRAPGVFSHVYCQALVNHQWIGFDASHGKVPGWEFASATRYQIWSI